MPYYTLSVAFNSFFILCLSWALTLNTLVSVASAYEPEIKAPRLAYLDTNSGLSQDTIESMLIDTEGFLWLGTEEGLDRFDGHNVVHVSGSNGMLMNNPVYYLFQYDERYIILSTGLSGIVKFDKVTGHSEVLLKSGYRFDPQWDQYSDAMLKDKDGTIVVALNEEIYRLDPSTNASELLLSLSDEQVQKGEAIRAIYLHEGIILVGTNYNLWAFDPNSDMLHRVNHTDNTIALAQNVKQLFSADGLKLWVGTVAGLYELDLAEMMSHIFSNWDAPSITAIDSARNIWALKQVSEDTVYVGTDIGLFKASVQTRELSYLFELNKQFEVLSTPDIRNIEIDGIGNLWMGTMKSGAIYWSPSSLLFQNVYAANFNNQQQQLSSNVVTSVHQHNPDSLWLGTNNGLNHYSLRTGLVQQYFTSENGDPSYSASDIFQVGDASRETLWVINGEGLFEFDIASGTMLPNARFGEEIDRLFTQYTFSFQVQSESVIWVSNTKGIFKVDLKERSVLKIRLSSDTNRDETAHRKYLLGLDNRSGQLLVARAAQLWGVNINTGESELLHSAIIHGANMMSNPTSWLRDTKNNFWLSYLGIGLFQLNGTSFSEINFYHAGNKLPTNIIYGLEMDTDGDIWFSSHSGIHAFDPSEETVRSFGYVHGLSSSEFNEGASAKLTDGRLLYAGNLGFTKFNPTRLKSSYQSEPVAPVISEINLATRSLDLPLTNLDGHTIVLEAEDQGLTLRYSMLNFDQSNLNRYQYRIIDGDRVTNYPMVTSSEIVLPALLPGDYTIEVLNANYAGNEDAKASINVKVKYPVYISPLAIAFYFLIVALLCLLFVWRRYQTQKVITEANRKVAEYNNRLTNALKASNADIWEWESDTNTLSGARLMSELERIYESIDFDEYVALIDQSDRQAFLKSWERFTLSGADSRLDITYRIHGASGQKLWYRDVGSLKVLKNGVKVVSGTYTNLTETLAAKEKLKVFGEAFNHTRDWVIIFDNEHYPIDANPSFMHAFGIDSRRPLAQQISRIQQEYHSELNVMLKKMRGLKASERWKTESTIRIQHQPMTLLVDMKAIPKQESPQNIEYYLCIFTDITEQILAQNELQQLASYDVLTGLINRSLLIERLQQSIHYAKRHLDKLAVLFIDLDRFKPINDSFGHDAGDKVLIEIASRLSAKFRGQDSVARIGGDEFVVVLNEIKDKEALGHLVEDILNLVTQPISIGFQNVTLSASIGIAIYPDHAADPENLVRNADIAMYAAKNKGKNNAEYFFTAMNDKVHANILLENRIKAALTKREFVNFYQPIIDLQSGKTGGFELLLRWFDNGKFVSPNVFIPLAEQIGCIIGMTEIAIELALADMASWRQKGFKGYVAINLSAKHFNQAFPYKTIIEQLDKHHLPLDCLRFEITESLLMENSSNSIQYMNDLRDIGFKISLDDFGTGYSSLRYLKDFPIDVLKLDKSFVDDLIQDSATQSIIYSTLVMAELLELDTVAEGVETEEQLDYFKSSKCKMVQGFFFSKPVSVEKTYNMLNKVWFKSRTANPAVVYDLGVKRKEK